MRKALWFGTLLVVLLAWDWRLALLYSLLWPVLQISIPNTFVADTIADPDQVNQNFDELGTKALNRAGGTITGPVTLQGNVTLDPNVTIDGADISDYLDGAGNITASGNVTATNVTASNTVTATYVTASGTVTANDLILSNIGSAVHRNTSDGADTGFVVVTGAGAAQDPTRGAYISLYGNEASPPGSLYCGLGNVAGSAFVVFGASGSGVFTVNGADGRVGLSMVPEARLCVKQSNNGAAGGLRLVRGDASNYADLYVGSDNNLYLQPNAAGFLLVTPSGDVEVSGNFTTRAGGVQINSPANVALNVNATHANGANMQLSNNGTGVLSIGSQLIGTGSGSASDMAFTLSGSLFLWSNGGGANAGFFPHQSDNHRLGRSGNRWKEVWAQTGTIQTSDRRKKTDISPSDCGLSFVNALQPVRYRWRDDTDADDRLQYGLIAQDLLALDGGAAFVHGNDAEGWGTNYSSFIAPLIAAVQEVSRRLAALERTTQHGAQ